MCLSTQPSDGLINSGLMTAPKVKKKTTKKDKLVNQHPQNTVSSTMQHSLIKLCIRLKSYRKETQFVPDDLYTNDRKCRTTRLCSQSLSFHIILLVKLERRKNKTISCPFFFFLFKFSHLPVCFCTVSLPQISIFIHLRGQEFTLAVTIKVPFFKFCPAFLSGFFRPNPIPKTTVHTDALYTIKSSFCTCCN